MIVYRRSLSIYSLSFVDDLLFVICYIGICLTVAGVFLIVYYDIRQSHCEINTQE